MLGFSDSLVVLAALPVFTASVIQAAISQARFNRSDPARWWSTISWYFMLVGTGMVAQASCVTAFGYAPGNVFAVLYACAAAIVYAGVLFGVRMTDNNAATVAKAEGNQPEGTA